MKTSIKNQLLTFTFAFLPVSAEEFVRRHRRVAFVPIRFHFNAEVPGLELDLSDANEKFKAALKSCAPAN